MTKRSIDKKENAFDSLRNRTYWMLTITTIVLIPLLSMEKFNSIDLGWIIVIGLIGILFLFIVGLFYYGFVRPKEFPLEVPAKVAEDTGGEYANFAADYIKHLVKIDIEGSKIIRLAEKRFYGIMGLMLLAIIGVIIFITIGGKL